MLMDRAFAFPLSTQNGMYLDQLAVTVAEKTSTFYVSPSFTTAFSLIVSRLSSIRTPLVKGPKFSFVRVSRPNFCTHFWPLSFLASLILFSAHARNCWREARQVCVEDRDSIWTDFFVKFRIWGFLLKFAHVFRFW
jgi:hypothetical protein